MIFGKITINDLKGTKSTQFLIVQRVTTVGRDKNCDIRIENPKIDGRQFLISSANRGLVKIQNLSKRFPTRLNEESLGFEAQRDLKESDVIAIGNVQMSWTYNKTGNTPVAAPRHTAVKRPRASEPARQVAVVTPNCRENVIEDEDELPPKRPRHHCHGGPFTPQPSAFVRRSMYDKGLKTKHPTPNTRGKPGLCTPLGSAKKKRLEFAEPLETPKLQYNHNAAFNKSITPRTFFGPSGASKPFTFGAFSRIAGTSRGALTNDGSYHEGSDHARGRRSERVSTPFPKKLSSSFSNRTPRSKGASGLYFPAIDEGRNVQSPGRSGEARGGFSMDVASSILIPPMVARDSTPSSYFSPSVSGSPRIMRAESPNIPPNSQPQSGRKSLMSSRSSSFGTPQGGRFHDSREQDSMFVNTSSRSQAQMQNFDESRFSENRHFRWSSQDHQSHQNPFPMTPPSMRTPRRGRTNESPGSAKFSPMSCDASYVLLSPRGRSITANRGYGNSDYIDSRLLMSAPSRSDFNFTASPERPTSHFPKTPKRSLSMQVLARSLQKKLHRSMSEPKPAYSPSANYSSSPRSSVRHNASPVMNSLSHLASGDASSSSQANGELLRKNSRRSKNETLAEDKSPKKKSLRKASLPEEMSSPITEPLPQDDIIRRKSRGSARQSTGDDNLDSQNFESLNNRRSRASQKAAESNEQSVTSPRRSLSAPSSRLSRRSAASEKSLENTKTPPVKASPRNGSVPKNQRRSTAESPITTPRGTRKSDASIAQSPGLGRRSRSASAAAQSPKASSARVKEESGITDRLMYSPVGRSRASVNSPESPKASPSRKKSDVANIQQSVPAKRSRASRETPESRKEPQTAANRGSSASARQSRSSGRAPEIPKASPARMKKSGVAHVQESAPARRSRSSGNAPESPKVSPAKRKSDGASVLLSPTQRQSRSSGKAPENAELSPAKTKKSDVANVQQPAPAKWSRSSSHASESPKVSLAKRRSDGAPKVSLAKRRSDGANVLLSPSQRRSRSSVRAPGSPKASPARMKKSGVAHVQESAPARRSRSSGNAPESSKVSPAKRKSDGASVLLSPTQRRSRSSGKAPESPEVSPAKTKKSDVANVQQSVPAKWSRSSSHASESPKVSLAKRRSDGAPKVSLAKRRSDGANVLLSPPQRQSRSSVGAPGSPKASPARMKKSGVAHVQESAPARRSRSSGNAPESSKVSPAKRKSDGASVLLSPTKRRSRSSGKAPESPEVSPAGTKKSDIDNVQQSPPVRRSRSSGNARESPKASPAKKKSDGANFLLSPPQRRSRSSVKVSESPVASAYRGKKSDVANVQQSAPARWSRSSGNAPESPKVSSAKKKSDGANFLLSPPQRQSRSSGKVSESPEASPARVKKSDVANVQQSAPARRSRSTGEIVESPNVSPTRRISAPNIQSSASRSSGNAPEILKVSPAKRKSVDVHPSAPPRRSRSSGKAETSPGSPTRSSSTSSVRPSKKSMIEEAGTSRTSPVIIGPRRSKFVPATVNIKIEPNDSSRSKIRLETSQSSLRPSRGSLNDVGGSSPSVSSIKKSSSTFSLLSAVKTEPVEDGRRSSKRSSVKIQSEIQDVSKIPASNSQVPLNYSSQEATVSIADLSSISGPRKTRVGFSSPEATINKKTARVTSTPFPRARSHSRTRNSESFDPLLTLSVDTTAAQSSYVCSNSPAYDTIITDKEVDASVAFTLRESPKRSRGVPAVIITEATLDESRSLTPSPVKMARQSSAGKRRSTLNIASSPPGTPRQDDTPLVVMRSSRQTKAGASTTPSTPTSCFRKNPRRKVKKATPSASLVWKKLNSLSPRKDTPVKKLSLDPEKPDKKKMAALLACHKKKSPTKESRLNASGPSEEKTPDNNLTPLKDLDKQPEQTSPEDALLNALDLSRKSTLALEPQKPARRLRSSARKPASLPAMPRPVTTPSSPSLTKSVKKLLFKSPLVEYENNRSPKRVDSPTRTIKSILIPSPTTSSDEPMSRIFTTSPVMAYTDSTGKKKSFRVSPTSKSSVIKELIPAEEIDLEGVRNLFETTATKERAGPSSSKRRKGGAVEEESPPKVARVSPKQTPAKNTRGKRNAVQESGEGDAPSRKTRSDSKDVKQTATSKQKAGATRSGTPKAKPQKSADTSGKSKKAVVSVGNVSFETPPPASTSRTRAKKAGRSPNVPLARQKTEKTAVSRSRGAKAPSKLASPKPGPSSGASSKKKVASGKKRISLVVRKVSGAPRKSAILAKPKKAAARLIPIPKAEVSPKKPPTKRNVKIVSSEAAPTRTTRGTAKVVMSSRVASPKTKTGKSVSVKTKPSPAKPGKSVPARKPSPAKAPKSVSTAKKQSPVKAPKPVPTKKKPSPAKASKPVPTKKKPSPAKPLKSVPMKKKASPLKAGKAVLAKKKASLAKPKKPTRAIATKASLKKPVVKTPSPKAGRSRVARTSPKPGPSKRAASPKKPVTPKKIATPKKRGAAKKVATPKASSKKPKASPVKSKIDSKQKSKPSPAKPKKTVAKAKAVKSPQGAAKKKVKTSPAKPPTPRKTRNAAKATAATSKKR